MHVKNLCKSIKTDLLINLRDFIYADQRFMHCNVWRDKNLCGTNLCDQRLTRIIRINKTRAEKCRFTVYAACNRWLPRRHCKHPIPKAPSIGFKGSVSFLIMQCQLPT